MLLNNSNKKTKVTCYDWNEQIEKEKREIILGEAVQCKMLFQKPTMFGQSQAEVLFSPLTNWVFLGILKLCGSLGKKNGLIWWFMILKMWFLKCVRFIVLVWVSSRTGFSHKNARENPKTKLQFSFVPFKGTSNLSLFSQMSVYSLMDRYKIFLWLQAVYCIVAQFLH